jgi:hypothetical protein
VTLFDVGQGPLELDLLLRCPAVGAVLVLPCLREDLVNGIIRHLPQPLQGLDLLQIHIFLIFFEHEAGAIPAYGAQHLPDQFGEAYMNYRSD